MELKKIDNLLQELKDTQLSKESLTRILGGSDPFEHDLFEGVLQWKVDTVTGWLRQYYDAETDVYMWVNQHIGQCVPGDLGSNDRTPI